MTKSRATLQNGAQAHNAELIVLNNQLHETLERQRTTSEDLQNILYSTDVAILLLDNEMNIRFFTPATKLLYNVTPADIGRPLADIGPLAADGSFLADARLVQQTFSPHEREITSWSGAWYLRRIMPYRTRGGGIEGVVITFSDITERRRIADALEEAKRLAERANVAKSRFLAAASHDLRQPLQTLALLQGLLARIVTGEKAEKLVARLDDTLLAISDMLNALLDINQIEAGTLRADIVEFPINQLLGRLKDEFTYHAQAQRLTFHVVPCGLSIRSDPMLLEQMIRNLLANALKYTKRGKVLLGCRRHGDMLGIEVWDTGIGIPEEEIQAIFDEYHQIDNVARERSQGLGLGLSIVQRLENLLGHPVRVRSQQGKGSVFAIEAPLASGMTMLPGAAPGAIAGAPQAGAEHRTGSILVIEDDPEVRDLLDLHLKNEGHHVISARDGDAALELVGQGKIKPDLVLADYNLPNGLNGLQIVARLRDKHRSAGRVIILTGDISTGTLRDIAQSNCLQLNKPVKLDDLTQAIQRLLPPPDGAPVEPVAGNPEPGAVADQSVIFVVDDDSHIRAALRSVLEDDGRIVEDFATCEAFLDAYRPGREACLLVDAYLPGMDGLELLRQLRGAGHMLPAIMITGNSDVPMAVQAMKAGASDFIEKPVSRDELLACIARALDLSRDTIKLSASRAAASGRVASLTQRQRQILDMVLAGHPSKNIAADLGISQRTVENHRASIMKKTGSKSLPVLARLALAAAGAA